MPPAEQGGELVARVGCLSCHKLDDRDGRVGPELAFTAVQRDRPWLLAHFHDPKSVVPGSLMPPYPLPAAAFESLSAYLLSRTPPAVPADPAGQYAGALRPLPWRQGAGRRGDLLPISIPGRATSPRPRS